MSQPTVLVLGHRKTDNMPSLTRMLEILRPQPGMHVEAPAGSVRVTGRTCPKMDELPDHCSVTGTQDCPDDQATIDRCPTC